MTSRHSPALKAIAILLVLSLAQVCVLANPGRVLFGRLVTNSDDFVIVNGNGARAGTTILSGASLQTPAGVTASVQLGSLGKVDIMPGTTLTLSFAEGNVAVEVTAGQAFLVTGEGVKGSIKNPESELFRTEVGPAPAPDAAAMRACMRAAEDVYRSAIRAAQRDMAEARRKAQVDYQKALRAATDTAQRRAAQMARQQALREAQQEFRKAQMAAQLARRQANLACRTQAQTPSDTANNSSNSPNSQGPSFGKIFIPGLGIMSGSILAAIYVPCRRGRNPSPGDPRGRNDECRREF